MNLLDFEFLVILNLFILLLYPATGPYRTARYDVASIIMIILTIIAVVLDVAFLVLKAVVH